MLDKWLAEQDGAFRHEVGTDARRYMSTSCSLKELEELDDRFINSPEGNDERSSGSSD